MKTKLLLSIAILLVLAVAGMPPGDRLSAEDKPDFTGKWKLDTAKSDFGMAPPTESETRAIEHKDPKLKVATATKGAQGERSFENNYTTDGKESTNTQGTRETKTIVKWEDKKIVMTWKVDFQGQELNIKEAWELGEGGKGMTVNREYKTAAFETAQKLVFTKE